MQFHLVLSGYALEYRFGFINTTWCTVNCWNLLPFFIRFVKTCHRAFKKGNVCHPTDEERKLLVNIDHSVVCLWKIVEKHCAALKVLSCTWHKVYTEREWKERATARNKYEWRTDQYCCVVTAHIGYIFEIRVWNTLGYVFQSGRLYIARFHCPFVFLLVLCHVASKHAVQYTKLEQGVETKKR